MDAREKQEMVMVVPRADVPDFQGFLPVDRRTVSAIARRGRYMKRALAEEDPSFKQLIPYSIIMHDGLVFKYRRGVKGGESRLHGLISIGVGGHISAVDEDLFGEAYDQAFARELSEEVVMDPLQSEIVCGLINDDSNPVGRVHLGVVHLLQTSGPMVRSNEKALVDAGFTTVEKLLASPSELETWSSICLANWDSIQESR